MTAEELVQKQIGSLVFANAILQAKVNALEAQLAELKSKLPTQASPGPNT